MPGDPLTTVRAAVARRGVEEVARATGQSAPRVRLANAGDRLWAAVVAERLPAAVERSAAPEDAPMVGGDGAGRAGGAGPAALVAAVGRAMRAEGQEVGRSIRAAVAPPRRAAARRAPIVRAVADLRRAVLALPPVARAAVLDECARRAR
jgi:hypothetical protein